MFLLVLALFSKFKIVSHKHSGAKTQFSLQFIKSGLIDKEYGKLFGDLKYQTDRKTREDSP